MRPGARLRRGVVATAIAAAVPTLAAGDGLVRIDPPGLRPSPFYAHVVVAPAGGRIVHVAGQIGFDGEGRLSPDFAEQVRQAFANLAVALEAAGAGPQHVAKITVLIVDHAEAKLGPLGAATRSFFGDRPPASTLVPVPRLALDGLLFEIDAVAIVPE